MTALPGYRLRDYQEAGVVWLHNHPRTALFLDMGLGKTCICLTALTPDRLPALVVAPKRVAESTWPTETEIWRTDLTCVAAAGTKAQRLDALRSGADIVTIGRENFGDVLEAFGNPPFKTLIIDELSGMKNRGTVRWRLAKKLIWAKNTNVANVWGLTGTPAPNGVGDLWAQIFLLDKGQRLYDTLGKFREKWMTPGRRLPNGAISRWHVKPGEDFPELQEQTAAQIHARLEDLCLSMGTEGRVHLPPVTYNEIPIELPGQAVRAYRELKRDLLTDMDILGGEVHTARDMAALSARLSQVSAGFLYSDDKSLGLGDTTRLHYAKKDAVQRIVDENAGSPVLVFYTFREELPALLTLNGARILRTAQDIKDWNAGRIPILLTHPQSAGHGLNLQHGGHTIVWTLPPWSLEEWQQANKRLLRSGQKHPVVIHLLMAFVDGRESIDHVRLTSVNGKNRNQQTLLDHLESPL